MTEHTYRTVPAGSVEYTDGGYVDLDHDDHGFTHDGVKLTEQKAVELGREALERFERHRTVMGRPSLSAPGEVSPTINARIPRDMKERLRAVAAQRRTGEAQVVREALEEYLSRAHP